MLLARAGISARPAAGDRPGAIFGTVTGPDGRPLAGACVTAFGSGRNLTVPAAANGQFVLGGLQPGRYVLEYRDCAAPAKYLARWSGGVSWRNAATPLAIGTGQVRHVPALMLQPADAATMLADRASWHTMLAHAAGRGLSAAAAAKAGRISGVVTGAGKELRGICVLALPNNGNGYGATTRKNGTYTIRDIAPGRYHVSFAADLCDGGTNWLQQEYPDENGPFSVGRPVKVTAGKTTAGIDGHLRLGGQISGTVTNASGKKLSGMCVNTDGVVKGGFIGLTARTSRRGRYILRALFPGKYPLAATIGCGSRANYAPASHPAIKISYGRVVSRANIVMPVGAEVTGKVTATTSGGQPLTGMCVFASNASGSITGNAATTAAGTYEVRGLGSGTYQLEFAPGCNTNANYVPVYVTVHTTEGKVTRGVNAVLQIGGIIAGKVTNTGGNPVGGMCVELEGTGAGNIPEFTGNDGGYQINQLTAGTYEVGFAGGCGNTGSFAPYWYQNQSQQALATPIVLAAAGKQTVNAVLQPGATIRGRLTAAGGAKVRDACVAATSTDVAGLGAFDAITQTGGNGTYSVPSLAPGQYLMDFGCGFSGKYGGQWFTGAPDAGDAALISAPTGTTSGINAVLKPGGSISGIVTGARGRRLAGICANAYSTADKTSMFQTLGMPGVTVTGSSGRYTIGGLAAGRYHVGFAPCDSNLKYAHRWYRRQSSEANATVVRVRAGATTPGVDGRLIVGGAITGRVKTPAGKPLRNICVEALDLPSNFGVAFTGKTGRYKITGLNSAGYTMVFIPCTEAENLVSVLSAARVTAPKVTAGVNATMVPGLSVSGTVTAAGPGVQDECVEAISANPANPGGGVVTGLNGKYTVTGLAAGTYQVFFADPGCPLAPPDLAPQWYDDKPTQAKANSVTLSAGTTPPTIDAALQPDGEITGSVSGPSATAPSGVCVTAVPTAGYGRSDGVLPVVAVTRAGSYSLADLLPGRYKVRFSSGCGATGYATQWWQDAKSQAAAKNITVGAGTDVSRISATLTH